MSDITQEALNQRLDHLERQNRIWRFAAAMGVIPLIVILLAAATPTGIPAELRAKSFVVVDDAGMRRAVLNVTNDVAALYLAGSDGVDRTWFEVAGNEPRIVFRDSAKRQRLILGGFTLSLTSGVTELRPVSSLVLIDADGRISWKVP